MKRSGIRLCGGIGALVFAGWLLACGNETAQDSMGDAATSAVETIEEAVEEAVDVAADAVETATEAVEDAADAGGDGADETMDADTE